MGYDQVEASSFLESAGFKVTVKQSYSDTVESGKVISQSPVGTTSTTPGATVTITVSLGKETNEVTVPNLFGYTQENAIAQLEALGLKYNIRIQASSNAPEGRVVAQSISAGEKVDEGTTVTLYVSAGNSSTTAPDEGNEGTTGSDEGGQSGNGGQQDTDD